MCAGTPIGGATTDGPTTWTFVPDADLPFDAPCSVHIAAGDVTDVDAMDLPDTMKTDFDSLFTTATPTPTPNPSRHRHRPHADPDPPDADPAPTPTPEPTPTPTTHADPQRPAARPLTLAARMRWSKARPST